MNPEMIMTMGREALEITILVSGPLLLVALVIGLIISIFQAATQINEATLSFIPKLIGIFITLIVAGSWMLTLLTDYLRLVLSNIPNLVG